MNDATGVPFNSDASNSVGPGSRIGRYTLLNQIGEGRNCLVFLAAQVEPVDRFVALKLIKPGMDSKEVVARFEAERQALAMLNHPNIVHLLEAGTMESGRPYFVMELIRGFPITDFCDHGRLDLNKRLALFVPVCNAVQHVHQRGIIHRDIEPSNVLVAEIDGRPFPMLIDFGIAKAANSQLLDRTTFARFPPQMIGKPSYMSPEQALMNSFEVDTRTDVYSLGALLYELLTGSAPRSKLLPVEASDDVIRRVIQEEIPPKPNLNSKLDCILLKAIEKDRTRRYQTAVELSADIERYLNGKRVLACPPTFGDRLFRRIRRGKM